MKKHKERYLRAVPAYLSFLCFIIASTVLAGWILDSARLKTLITGSIPMNPVTAVCFLILSVCLLLLYTSYTKIVRFLGIVVTAVGLLKLFSLVSGIHIPIDQQLFIHEISRQHPASTIAPNTALNFSLVGISIVLVTLTNRKRLGLVANSLSLVTIFLAFVALNGYFYGINSLYGVGAVVPMAFPTAICFLLLSSAVLLLRPQANFLSIGMQKSLLQSKYLRPVHFVAFLAIPMVFIIVNGISYRNTRAFEHSRQHVDSAYQAVVTLDSTLQLLDDAETGQRGYLLTGEPQYLEPYNQAVKNLPITMAHLKAVVSPSDKATVDQLSTLTDGKLAELQQTIALRQQNQTSKALSIVLTNRGKAIMDNIRILVAQLQSNQYKLLIQNKTAEASKGRVTSLYIAGGTVLNLALLTGLYVLLVQQLEHNRQEKTRIDKIVLTRTAELKLEKARLQSSVDSLTTGFVMTDTAHNLLMVNETARTLLGVTESNPADAVFKNASLKRTLEATMHDKKIHELPEHTLGHRILRIIMAPVIQNSTVIGTVVNIIDISEQKALDRSRDEFFSIASHELRTPLTSLRGNSRMILDMYGDSITDKDVVIMLEDMYTASVRLIETVNAFLDMSSLEQKKLAFTVVPTKIENILHDAQQTFQMVATSKINVQIKGELDYVVLADEIRLKQILNILLSNAVKFTNKGSVILSARRQGNNIDITVQDSGKGIPKDHQYLLFRKFQQASKDILTRDATHSVGLGLYIAKMLAEGMDGTLELESSEEGKGSVFCLSFPEAHS
jgi:signal transduction histidine kinase